MKTIVYIDGYNLYYSRLQHTPYKWLDIKVLFEKFICHQQNPASDVVSIRYFTSNVKAKFARHGQRSMDSQNRYLRALEALHPGIIRIERSNHDTRMANPMLYLEPPDHEQRVNIWKIEEKQTDVHIATQMYRDASRGSCEQIVLCTNDSDLEPPLRYIRDDFPHIQLGLVTPGLDKSVKAAHRPVSTSLSKHCHWTRTNISDEELRGAQLPDRVPTRKKPIDKPDYWRTVD